MSAFDGVLLCTDLDGTLLRHDKTVSPENLRAIERFKAGGGKFTYITGRLPFFAPDIYKLVQPNVPIGCANGGGVYDYESAQYVWSRPLSRAAFEVVKTVDRELPSIGFQVVTFTTLYSCKENPAMNYFRAAAGVPDVPRHYLDIPEPISKIVFADETPHVFDNLRELFINHPLASEFSFVQTESYLYELLPAGISKATALEKICKISHTDLCHTVAVGDYDNDIPLLRQAGVGIAVANACDAAKAAADRITVSNEEHAIARIIEQIEDGTITFPAFTFSQHP